MLLAPKEDVSKGFERLQMLGTSEPSHAERLFGLAALAAADTVLLLPLS